MSYNRRAEKLVGTGVSLAGGTATRKIGAGEDSFVLNKVVVHLTTAHTAAATITVKKGATVLSTGVFSHTGAAVGDSFVVEMVDANGYPIGVTFDAGEALVVTGASGTTGVANIYAVGGIVPR